MATLGSWVENTRSLLMTGLLDKINALTAPYTAGGTTATLSLTPPLVGVAAGTRLTIGLNTFYVISADSTGGTVVAYPGMEATTDASAATGSLVRIGPRFTDAEIAAAINSDLVDLSSPGNDLFQVGSVDISTTPSAIGYDLTGVTDLISIIEVRSHNPASTLMDYGLVDQIHYRLNRNQNTATFPSGYSLQVNNPGAMITASSWGTSLLGVGTTVGMKVLYRKGFTQLVNLTDAQSLTGLPATAYDLPPIGAAMRLVIPREIRRNFTESQGDTRRQTEVPPGAISNSYRGLMMLRQQRIAAESARLTAAYPSRIW